MLYYTSEENGLVTYHDEVENMTFSIPREDFAGLISGRGMPALEGDDICLRALREPIGSPTISELVRQKNAKTVSIIVSDGTRGVPTNQVSGLIIEELIAAGIKLENILFIVALGLHRPPTEAEYRAITDEKYYGKVRMIASNAFDPDSAVNIGVSSRGTPIDVNREAYECDLHIAIGKAELHAMAGFSGGRKSVLPGIASYRTIIGNHTAQMITDKRTRRGVLEGNPFHIEMLEAARMYGVDFCVTFVINEQNRIAGVFAGDLDKSHVKACDLILSYANVQLSEKPDIIFVTTGLPLNVNFYQASRAMRVLNDVIDEHTVVAFYAGCPEGVMSDVMLLPFEHAHTVDDAEKWMWENWEPRMDDALLFIKTLRTGAHFICYSPGVDGSEFEKMLCQSADSCEDLVAKAYAACGKEHPRVMFYPLAHKYFTSLPDERSEGQ